MKYEKIIEFDKKNYRKNKQLLVENLRNKKKNVYRNDTTCKFMRNVIDTSTEK